MYLLSEPQNQKDDLMKTMKVLVLVSLSFGLGLSPGCATDENPDSVEDSAVEDLGQVQQEVNGPCRGNFHCPLGERCDLTIPYPGGGGELWTCRPYFVIGPVVNPCVDTPQCQFQFNWNSYCNIQPGASYGQCIPL